MVLSYMHLKSQGSKVLKAVDLVKLWWFNLIRLYLAEREKLGLKLCLQLTVALPFWCFLLHAQSGQKKTGISAHPESPSVITMDAVAATEI